MSKLLRVLIVEDSEDDAELLAIELKRGGYDITYKRVDTKADMKSALTKPQSWDIILADYSLPQFSGLAALELVRELQLDLPFAIVSGKIGEDTGTEAMRAGAHDYIDKNKPFRLVPVVERELERAVLREEHRDVEKRLRYLDFYDELTGLPNRTLFLEYVGREIACQKELNGYFSQDVNKQSDSFAVMLLSIDRFRNIKNSLSYLISQELSLAVARRLEQYLIEQYLSNNSRDIVARISEDEFALLITDIISPQDILDRAEDLYHQLIRPFEINGTRVCSTVSIGIALNQPDNRKPEKLLQWADTAMQYAKNHPAKTAVLFDKKMQRKAVTKIRLENDLQRAIDNRQLYLDYQPIVSLATGKTASLEALVRWKHDSLGSISPDTFIPLCEETGQIVALGQWVLEEACSQFVDWRKSLVNHDNPLTVSINLSPIQIHDPELIPQIDRLLERLNLSGKDLKLEITESTVMKNKIAVTEVLKQLKEREIQLCLDDFGTRFSWLNYLRFFPVDIVKIDRSFIKSEINNTDYGIIKTIINIADYLGLDVIAEGIETEVQLEILRSLGCEYGQGFHLAHPLASKGVLNFVQQ